MTLTNSKAFEMAQIRSTVNVIELITPDNYFGERERWLDGGRKFFSPQFTYDEDAIKDAIRRIDLLASLEDLLQSEEYYGSSVYKTLEKRCRELANLKIFLETLIDARRVPGEHCCDPLYHLYGDVKPDDIEFAERLVKTNPEDAYTQQFIRGESWKIRERKRFVNDVLKDFRGMFSEEDKKRLKAMEFDAEGIAKYFQLVLEYMRKNAVYSDEMAGREAENPSYGIEISSRWTAVSVNAFSESGKSVIGIPVNRKVDGLKLVELVSHELNSHYRSAMSVRAYFGDLLKSYGDAGAILPLIPMVSHSLNETLSEGLAKVGDIRVSGAAGMPKPYSVLAIDFVRQGHNFQETMEYIFELMRRQNAKIEESAALNSAWNCTYRIFRGQRDTSSRCGYVFPKDKVYLCGFMTVATNYSEGFMNLLRYSTLTLEELESLDGASGHDLYPGWKYDEIGSDECYADCPDPVNYIADLLLN